MFNNNLYIILVHKGIFMNTAKASKFVYLCHVLIYLCNFLFFSTNNRLMPSPVDKKSRLKIICLYRWVYLAF